MSEFNFSVRYNEIIEKSKNIDKMSDSELINFKTETQEVYDEYDNFQLVVKRNANSLYGVSANQFFSLHDTDVAEDITITGKHYAVIVDIAINNFFKNWGDDLNILEKIKEFYPNVIKLHNFSDYVKDTKMDLCCYGDTDSRYVRLDYIYNLIEDSNNNRMIIPNDSVELSNFAIFLNENFISKLIAETIDKDCTDRNARKGFLKMNHEVTSRKGIFLKKKKYMLSTVWADGKHFEKPKLKITGVELKKGSTSEKAKKILANLVDKYLVENRTIDDLREDCLKIFKYIKFKKDKELIYLISSVSNFGTIKKNDENIWYHPENKNHIQMQMVLSWLNFIEKNNLTKEYKAPFEGQKMQYYYCEPTSGYKVIAIPDDVDINKVPNLPEPDWKRMIIAALLKPFCNYILDKTEIDEVDVENFLLGVKIWKF